MDVVIWKHVGFLGVVVRVSWLRKEREREEKERAYVVVVLSVSVCVFATAERGVQC